MKSVLKIFFLNISNVWNLSRPIIDFAVKKTYKKPFYMHSVTNKLFFCAQALHCLNELEYCLNV